LRDHHGFPQGEKRSGRRRRPQLEHGACPGSLARPAPPVSPCGLLDDNGRRARSESLQTKLASRPPRSSSSAGGVSAIPGEWTQSRLRRRCPELGWLGSLVAENRKETAGLCGDDWAVRLRSKSVRGQPCDRERKLGPWPSSRSTVLIGRTSGAVTTPDAAVIIDQIGPQNVTPTGAQLAHRPAHNRRATSAAGRRESRGVNDPIHSGAGPPCVPGAGVVHTTAC
jgi:hypothetical protein